MPKHTTRAKPNLVWQPTLVTQTGRPNGNQTGHPTRQPKWDTKPVCECWARPGQVGQTGPDSPCQLGFKTKSNTENIVPTTKPDRTTKPDQTRPNQTKPDQTKPNQTNPDQPELNRLVLTDCVKTRPAWSDPNQPTNPPANQPTN